MLDKTPTSCRANGLLLIAVLLSGCDTPEPEKMLFSSPGHLANTKLEESSGVQASRSRPGLYWIHNDDGKARLYAIDGSGGDLGHFDIDGAKNKDWEDIALVSRPEGDLLVIADMGDNKAVRDHVVLYIVPEPAPSTDGRVRGAVEPLNILSLTWPDGPRDCEAMAWDPLGRQLLFLTKRDQPSRLYALPESALTGQQQATPEFIGTADVFRPPERSDRSMFSKQTPWISQPTGMDISADGQMAAVISYRSLYLFKLPADGLWATGLRTRPGEIYGPPKMTEEGVSFTADGQAILVIPEGRQAPVYRYDFVPAAPK